jgi:UDP-N-acetylglucosamine 2-epimerase (non-hydrolysing)
MEMFGDRKKKVLFVFGTRPEAIKMAPLIKEFQISGNQEFETMVCVTAQHRSMLDQVLSFFSIKTDYDLNIMRQNQDLFTVSKDILIRLRKIFEHCKPDIVFVQGDTTTAFIASLAAYYMKIRVAHLEAGLRSGQKYAPFPEEVNRRLISVIADYHFAPTARSKANLESENNRFNVYVTGNTGIDALHLGLQIIAESSDVEFRNYFSYVDFSKKIILVTAHRRENFGEPFENICESIKLLASEETEIIFPVHLNPQVRKTVYRILGNYKNIHLVEPLDYPMFIWLMKQSFLVLTDSGGIQEEAPSLGKPVLIMREVTERLEGLESGNAILVGFDKDKIFRTVISLISDPQAYNVVSKVKNPYGNGLSSTMIFNIIKRELISFTK